MKSKPHFTLDKQITDSTFFLADWPLCRVLLKNNALYPWFLLVPRRTDIREIYQLEKADQYQLIDEIAQLSNLLEAHCPMEKLNVGALGNIVSQLHIHVIARQKDDPLWPHGLWQSGQVEVPYRPQDPFIEKMKKIILKI